MTPTAVSRFAVLSAQSRTQVYGQAATLSSPGSNNARALQICFTQPSDTRELDEGGWNVRVAGLVRLLRQQTINNALVMLVVNKGDIMQFKGKKYVVEEVRDNPLNPELVFGIREE